jgi:hypothetical protein
LQIPLSSLKIKSAIRRVEVYKMNKEQKLLIALLRHISESEVKSFSLEDVDWQSLLQAADEHRVIPLINRNLRPFAEKLPSQVYAELQIRAERCSMQNLKLSGQLISLAKLFKENDIEFISYKGAALARLAYDDLSLRQFGDLDFLIHKKDFPKVKKAILENGGKPAWNLSVRQEKAVLKYYYEFPFLFGKNPPVLVEIHWAFMESFFGFDYEKEEVFSRTQNVFVHEKEIPTLSNEDLLIVLCVHGSKHFWKRLSWICDVGKLVEAQRIEWDVVIEAAEKNGCLRMLALGLLLAKDFLQIDLPERIRLLIKGDKEIASLAEELKKRIFDERFSAEAARPNLHLKMRERRRDKFAYSRRLFTTKLVDSLFMPMGRPR